MSAEAELIFALIANAVENERKLDILTKSLRKTRFRAAFFFGTTVGVGYYAIHKLNESKRRIDALEKELKNAKKKEPQINKDSKLIF